MKSQTKAESPSNMAFPPEISETATENIVEIGKCRYTTSKLCNLLCTYELARRLQDDERRISVNAFNPGLMLDTQLARGYSTKEKLSLLFNNFGVSLRQILKFRNSKNMGKALSLIILNPELDGITGKYFDGFHQEKSSTESHDLHKAAELWQASKALVGLEESV